MKRRHHDLEVWQEGLDLVEKIYAITQGFPSEERFGLTSQLRRAAVSIPSNIAEGAARNSRKDLANFVRIARGSVAELETQLLIAKRLGYVTAIDELDAALNSLFAKLNNLFKSLRE